MFYLVGIFQLNQGCVWGIDTMQETVNQKERKMMFGVIITCGSKEPWSNTFDAMCENYYHDIEVGLQKEMIREGYGLMVERMNTLSANLRTPMMLRMNRVDGVFVLGGVYRDNLLRMVQKYNVPVVLIGNSHPKLDYVTSEYTDGVYQGIKYLLERGHRDILFVNGPEASATTHLKKLGLQKAYDEFSMQMSERRCINSEFSGEGGYWAAKVAYEKSGLRPTAIFAGSDTIAAGVLGYLYEQKLRVPDDVSVVAYERGMLTEYLTPVLTSIEVHKGELGRKAVRMMVQRITNPEIAQQCCCVPVELKEGASVRSLNL